MSIRHIGVSIAALLLVAVPAYAQTGRICGTVTNPSGAGLAGVVVTLTSTPDGYTSTPIATTKTAAKGDYTFSSVAPGRYSLSYTLDGFKKVLRGGVLMTTGFEPRIDQRLEPGEDPVTVRGTTPLAREDRLRTTGNTFTGDLTVRVPTAQAPAQLSCGPIR